jgi:hypothetical protein
MLSVRTLLIAVLPALVLGPVAGFGCTSERPVTICCSCAPSGSSTVRPDPTISGPGKVDAGAPSP